MGACGSSTFIFSKIWEETQALGRFLFSTGGGSKSVTLHGLSLLKTFLLK